MECSIQLSNTENGNPTIFLGTFLRSIFKQIEYKHEFSKTTNSNFVVVFVFVFVFVFLLECCFFLSYFSFPKVLFSPSKSICWRASFYFHKCHFMPTTDLIRKRPKKAISVLHFSETAWTTKRIFLIIVLTILMTSHQFLNFILGI